MTDAQDSHARGIVHALDFIENNLTEDCNARGVARQSTMSAWHFQRAFHDLVGVPVTRYIRRRRLMLAADALDRSDRSIRDVALDAGFASHEVFTRAFQSEYGCSPSVWRRLAPDADGRALRPTRAPVPADAREQIEILHWWTHGAEPDAARALRSAANAAGLALRETAIAGGAGQAAVPLLEARCLAGFVPATSPVQGGRIRALARRGLIHALDREADAGDWDRLLPVGVQQALKVDGRYYAAPLHLHRINAMHVNLTVLRQAGLDVPGCWPDFMHAAQRLRTLGIPALALGEEPWQIYFLYSLLHAGDGSRAWGGARPAGAQVHWSGASAFRALTLLGELRPYALRNPGGRAWFHAAAAVASGKAAVQFMGDWARPELLAEGRLTDATYACAASPGTVGEFHLMVDALAMFRLGKDLLPAQAQLCQLAMAPEIQQRISSAKGALAARQDLQTPGQREAQGQAAQDLHDAARLGTLHHGLGQVGSVQQRAAASELVWRYWQGLADAASTATGLLRLSRGTGSYD